MKPNEQGTQDSSQPAELELILQEAHARRQRAAALFGEPDWDDEPDADAADDD
jgi:hypothetical protein